ncbi:GNAT family N-acetyltransferase [Deinococcus sp. HMF7604]|uniref:GNAT family N-acetyltransferase n=1 Tax=Deinococcus betulae TaxID=2873312 RepID=UPI001CCAB0B7|nr:GNAT family N-acetyltransferase [Deinococcus betulae]MBZ9749819.1 GNAT family N-acetyltransferase [Deinococcus betulae]
MTPLSPRELALARTALGQQRAAHHLHGDAAARQAFGLGAFEVGHAAALYARNAPWLGANTIVNLGTLEPATPEALAQLLSFFRDAALPFVVIVTPFAEPADLPEQLLGAGLSPWSSHWVLARPLSGPDIPLSQPAVAVQPLTGEQGEAVGRLMLGDGAPAEVLAFMSRPAGPHSTRYGVWAGTQLIATAELTVAGQLAYLSGAITHPDHRQQGLQAALLQRRLADAAALGCTVATTEVDLSNEASLRNVERAGFVRVYQEQEFFWRPPRNAQEAETTS